MDLTGTLKFLLGTALGVLGSVVTWRLRRGHERRELWARYALEITKLHLEAQQKEADATGQLVTVLAPTKLFREIFHAFEEFDRTREWSERAWQEGILNVFRIAPLGGTISRQEGGSNSGPAPPLTSASEEVSEIDRKLVVNILLQEDKQYREDIARYESGIMTLLLGYMAALVPKQAHLGT